MVLFNLIFTPRVNRKHLTGQSRLYFHAREFFLGLGEAERIINIIGLPAKKEKDLNIILKIL